jgi:hypothetical protein
VHFKPATPQAVVDQARFFLSSLGTVESVDVVPADQALAAFKERHGKNSELLGAVAELDQNPLGPALVVKAKKTSDYPLLVDALQNPQFSFAIESQSYDDHADAIAMVRQLGQSVRWFGGALIAVFALFSSLLVFNAIRVAIYTQREEIGVMRLVGASNPYIRLPFLLEGQFLVRDDLRTKIDFRVENLFESTPRNVHCIFCRNVMIYFQKADQEILIRRFYDALVPGGFLLVGHSESLHVLQADFTPVHCPDGVIYRK